MVLHWDSLILWEEKLRFIHMRVFIIAYNGVLPSSVVGPLDMISKAGEIYNQMTQQENKPPFFEVKVVSIDGQDVKGGSGYPVSVHGSIAEMGKPDLVLIPAPEPEFLHQLEDIVGEWIPWIKGKYKEGSEVASICLGAFILAKTGLLNGKKATTHWIGADLFRQLHPEVELLSERIIVDEGRLYSCGGASSFQNLIIYLVEKFCGKETAVQVSKLYLISPNIGPQNAFAIFGIQRQHSDPAIQQAQDYIEKNALNRISVEEIAEAVSMSKRSLYRKFKKATGNTPIEYIRRVKVEAAKRSLEMEDKTVEELVYSMGYEDPPSFRKLFKKYTGTTPTEYRKRYNFN